jgi:adenine-specific DNA-methyltransferase
MEERAMDNEKMSGLSMDIEAADREKLRAVFPQCFVEGKLDIDRLLNLCGEYITDDFEKYEFRWKGKGEALQLAGKRSYGTLRPCVEESVDWENTRNLYIEGDNLEVLKLLQTSYYRKVKMIYIDPPYNTGNDFVYADDFADPLARYREVTQQTTKSNPETMGRFHTNWLNMMWPRLRLAANLLRDDGVIFISIDDAEIDNMKKLCNEIFGEENFVACLVYDKNRKNDAKYFSVGHEYMLVYFKSMATVYDMGIILRSSKEGVDEVKAEFDRLRTLHNDDWIKVNEGLKALYASWPADDERKPLARFTRVDEKGPYRGDGNISWPGGGGPTYDVLHPVTGKPCKVPSRGWVYPNPKRMLEEIENGRVVFGSDETVTPKIRTNLFEQDKQVLRSVFFSYAQTATQEFNKLFDGVRIFENPKNFEDIKKLIAYITSSKDEDIIFDCFSGSATTAHAVMQLNAEDGGNRRFIMVQLPELTDEKSEAYKAGYKNICEIGKERIRRAGRKIYEEGLEKWTFHNISQETLPERLTDDGMVESGTVYHDEIRKEVYGKGDPSLDIGFRAFKLDSSNLKIWDDSPLSGEDAAMIFERRLLDYLDVLVPGRTAVEVVYEVMLKLGQDLCAPILAIGLPDNRQVYGVGEDVKFIVCLAENISVEDAKLMAEYAPGRIIFAEQCFQNTEQKSNVRLTLKDSGITIKTL